MQQQQQYHSTMSQNTSVTTKPLGESSTPIQTQDAYAEKEVPTSAKKKELNNGDDEDEDDDEEEDDEDYDPTKKDEDAEISDDDDVQQEDEKVPDFSKIESTISQVKTRSQRLQQKQEKQAKFIGKFETDSRGLVKETCSLDIDLIFDDLKENRVDDYRGELETDEGGQLQKDSKGSAEVAAVSATDEESQKIRIQINYTFAGKLITESKLVDINSAEAKAYLNSTSSITSASSSSNESQGKRTEVKVIRQDPQTKQDVELRIKLKRPSLIDKFIALNGNNKKMKLSTLEKSRLDWASFIDKRKIGDELKRHNRNGGGYLDKQEFLGRVDYKKDEIYQRAKEEERKRQFQLQGK